MYRVTKVYYGIILLYKTDYELLRRFKGIHTQIEEYTYLLTIRKIIYTFLYYENTTNIPVMSFSCLKKLLVFSFSGNFKVHVYNSWRNRFHMQPSTTSECIQRRIF